jgi:hypothetical protein
MKENLKMDFLMEWEHSNTKMANISKALSLKDSNKLGSIL